MKTVLVIYTDRVGLSKTEVARTKKYAFNTSSEFEIGDIIESQNYDTNMMVVKVLESSFTYFNAATGELSNDFTSTAQWTIRELVIREDEEEVVYGRIVNRL